MLSVKDHAQRCAEYVYIVDLLFNLDFVLNYVASNGLEFALFWNILPPSMWKSVRRARKNIGLTWISSFIYHIIVQENLYFLYIQKSNVFNIFILQEFSSSAETYLLS